MECLIYYFLIQGNMLLLFELCSNQKVELTISETKEVKQNNSNNNSNNSSSSSNNNAYKLQKKERVREKGKKNESKIMFFSRNVSLEREIRIWVHSLQNCSTQKNTPILFCKNKITQNYDRIVQKIDFLRVFVIVVTSLKMFFLCSS